MPDKGPCHYFFAGGGTGGHIYPALAVADHLHQKQDGSSVLFFCSHRDIDSRILSRSGYEFLPLPAVGLSKHPKKLVRFFAQFVKSYYFVKQILEPFRQNAVVIGTGGFVTAPVVMAARSLKIPVYLINVDSVPGKANRFLGRFARKVFVQFEETAGFFKKDRAEVVGCPLRQEFQNPDKHKAFSELALDEGKKVLLITGASSGSMNINNAVISIMPQLSEFADQWQVVHLTGQVHIDSVQEAAGGFDITYHAVDYYDNMPSLLAAADIVVGRSGAVSVAEYAVAGKPAICIPYPYHKDRHQYKNAQVLVDAGAAVIVEDNTESPAQTARDLLNALTTLMKGENNRNKMTLAAGQAGILTAAENISNSIQTKDQS
ncbi:MAG: undecaprenyldiphospho-muramoylpentapeptide beta-N-acetylglucosaminyltransferase [Planctomycetes bacterium]|nr:undecaprenyldiphospho-muramoylpentapeptide beta-N-acetylglucosaminyltransferase [Planctomycetota bacterium]